MASPLPDYELGPLNAAIADFQTDPANLAFQTELVDQLYRLAEAIAERFGKIDGEADDVIKNYEAVLAELIVDPEKIGPEQYAPLEKLMDRDASVSADKKAVKEAEGRQAVVARFYRHLKNTEAKANPELVARATAAGKESRRSSELKKRQGALNQALDNFLAHPENEGFQDKLVKEMGWFQECVLKQDKERLEERGIKSSITDDDLITAQLNSVEVNRRPFVRKHIEILELLTKKLPTRVVGDESDPAIQAAIREAKQQASAIGRLKEYIRQGALNQALDNFLAHPENEGFQDKLVKEMGWFQECVLKQDMERLEERGIKSSIADDDLITAQLNSVEVNRRPFVRKHIEILELLTKKLPTRVVGDESDPAIQAAIQEAKKQALAIRRLKEYIEPAVLLKEKPQRRVINYFLMNIFAMLALGSVALGLSLTLPLIAPSLAFGIVLAPPLALGLAATAAVLSLAMTFLMSSAWYSAQRSMSFNEGLGQLIQSIAATFRSTRTDSPIDTVVEPGLRGSLNLTDSSKFSPTGNHHSDDHPLARVVKADLAGRRASAEPSLIEGEGEGPKPGGHR